MKKKLIAIVSTTDFTITSFMLAHIIKLSKIYNVVIICRNAKTLKKFVPNSVLLKNICFNRKPNLSTDIISLFKLFYFFIKCKPDLTISISPKAGFITSLAAFAASVPYRVHWFTGQLWANKKGIYALFLKSIDRIIFKLSCHVLIDSFSQRKFLLLNNIVNKKKSSVISNGSVGGVNLKKFAFKKKNRVELRDQLNISKRDFIFLFLGRINREKGVLDLFKAFEKVGEQHKAFLVLVGPLEDENLARLTKNKKKIIFIRKTSNPEQWYSLADILCLPSYREGFGSSVIEAASCNLSTLASNIYGINDAIVKNYTGFFHKVGDINDLTNKMLFAIKNKRLLKEYGKAAKERVKKKFNEDLISEKFLKFINLKIKL